MDDYALQAMSYISQHPGCTQQEVADAMGVPLVVVAAIVVNLSDMGIIERS